MNRLLINFEDLISKNRKHQNDTGSAEYQIILLTQKINYLHENHLYINQKNSNHKDYPAKRSLIRWVAARHRHQRYLDRLYKHNPEAMQNYKTLLKELGLRR
jgi:ribosomal protein S15